MLFSASAAQADAVTEWNLRAGEFVTASGLITQPAGRVMAITHTAAFEAANAITRRYPSAAASRLEAPADASVEAAIAAAHRGALVRLLPLQESAIDGAYKKALAAIAEGSATALRSANARRLMFWPGALTTARRRLKVTDQPPPQAATCPRPFPPHRSGRSASRG